MDHGFLSFANVNPKPGFANLAFRQMLLGTSKRNFLGWQDNNDLQTQKQHFIKTLGPLWSIPLIRPMILLGKNYGKPVVDKFTSTCLEWLKIVATLQKGSPIFFSLTGNGECLGALASHPGVRPTEDGTLAGETTKVNALTKGALRREPGGSSIQRFQNCF